MGTQNLHLILGSKRLASRQLGLNVLQRTFFSADLIFDDIQRGELFGRISDGENGIVVFRQGFQPTLGFLVLQQDFRLGAHRVTTLSGN